MAASVVTAALPEKEIIWRNSSYLYAFVLTAALAVHIHQLVKVKAGPLHHLHLPDVHVVEGVDSWRDIFKKSVAIFQMKAIEGKLISA